MKSLELAREDYIGARTQQQDRAAVDVIDEGRGGVLILADGLGGHEGGAQASAIVEKTFLEAAKGGAFNDPARRRSALRDALESANTTIGSGVDPAHGHRGMASTAVVAIVAEGNVSWISVGDSHLYVWRTGKLTKLNEDHSQAGLMVRSGQYKETDPEVIAAKSVLVSALTGRKLEIVDHPQTATQLEAGDILILASDGLNTISEQEIADIVGKGSGQDAKLLCKALIEAVKERKADRQDNTTVAVARVLQVPKRQVSDAPTAVVAPARQVITTPTELPSAARAETQIPSKTPAPPERRASAADTPTYRVPVENTVRSVPLIVPKPGAAEARTAIPNAADARTAVPKATDIRPSLPGSAGPAPESRAGHPDSAPTKSVPLLGIAMLALATLFAALFIGRMMGWFDPLAAVFGPAQQQEQVKPVVPEKKKAEPVKGDEAAPKEQPKVELPKTSPVQPPQPAPKQPPQAKDPEQPVEPPPVKAPTPSQPTDTPQQRPTPPETQTPKPPNAGTPPPRTQAPGQPAPPQARAPVERPEVLPPLADEPDAPRPPHANERSGGLPGVPTGPRALTPDERRERARIEEERLRDEFQKRQQAIRDRDLQIEQERQARIRQRAEGACRPDQEGRRWLNGEQCYVACRNSFPAPPRNFRSRQPSELDQCLAVCDQLCDQ